MRRVSTLERRSEGGQTRSYKSLVEGIGIDDSLCLRQLVIAQRFGRVGAREPLEDAFVKNARKVGIIASTADGNEVLRSVFQGVYLLDNAISHRARARPVVEFPAIGAAQARIGIDKRGEGLVIARTEVVAPAAILLP